MNWLAFYRDQARLIGAWRAPRLALIRRGLLSIVATGVALLIISTISLDLHVEGPSAVVLAAVVITVLNSAIRPTLLLVLSPLPAIAVPIVGLVLEVPVVLIVGAVVPGVTVGTFDAAVRDAVMLDGPQRASWLRCSGRRTTTRTTAPRSAGWPGASSAGHGSPNPGC